MRLHEICNIIAAKIFVPGTKVECMEPTHRLEFGKVYEVKQNWNIYSFGDTSFVSLNGIVGPFCATRFRKAK